MTKIVILSGSLADLSTAVAALIEDGVWNKSCANNASAVIVGHKISLPSNLVDTFKSVARKAFAFSDINAFRWGEDEQALSAFVSKNVGVDIVAANQLQDKKQRDLISALQPKKFIFYDNGLSSYANHKVDLEGWMCSLPDCNHGAAYLSYITEFGVPSYLSPFTVSPLSPNALKLSLQNITDTCVPEEARLEPGATIILGTSFDRTGIVTTDEEKHIHQRLFEEVSKRHSGSVYFKPHPRAGTIYLNEADGVKLLPTELPIEAYIAVSSGTVYSYSSTALFSLVFLYGWTPHRATHPKIEKVFEARPQLSKIKAMQSSLAIGSE